MAPTDDYESQGSETTWPVCPYTEQDCIFCNMAQLLGGNILDSLLRFILTADKGARLTLQRNGDGFTLQVTGPVQRTSDKTLTPPDLRAHSLKIIRIIDSNGGGKNGENGARAKK